MKNYSNFNVLIINDLLEKSGPKTEQYEAIDKWVANGRILIINKGDSLWNLTRSKEDIIISDNVDILCEFADEESPIENLIVNNGSIDSGNVLLDFNGNVLVASQKYGKGMIYQTTFDLTSEPFCSWKGNSKFIKKLIESNMEILSEKANYNKYSNMVVRDDIPKEVMSELKNSNIKKIKLIISVLIAGVILGIGLKLINKRKNWIVIREINWIVIPVVSIVIAFGIYKFDSETPIVNNVSVIELYDANLPAKIEAGLTIYSNEKNIKLESRGNVYWEYIGNNNLKISDNDRESSKKELEYTISYDGNRTKIEMFNSDIEKPKKVRLTGYTINREFDERIFHSLLYLSGKVYGEILEIEIISDDRYPIRDAVIIYGKNVYQLDQGILYRGESYWKRYLIKSGISIDEYLSKLYENKDLAIGKDQLREIIESKTNSSEESLNGVNSNKLLLFAINGYEGLTFKHYTINGKEPKINSSVVYIKEGELFEFNQKVKLPEGELSLA